MVGEKECLFKGQEQADPCTTGTVVCIDCLQYKYYTRWHTCIHDMQRFDMAVIHGPYKHFYPKAILFCWKMVLGSFP